VIKKILRSKKGESSIFAVILVLAIIIIASGLFEHLRLMTIATGVRDSVQSAVISVVADNWDETYSGLREGYSGGYEKTVSTWVTNISNGDVYQRLTEELGLTKEGGYYVKYAGGVMEYRISGLAVIITNTPFAPTNQKYVNCFEAAGTISVEVPLSFGWESLPPMKLKLTLKAGFEPKF